jgi:hypothetical protein
MDSAAQTDRLKSAERDCSMQQTVSLTLIRAGNRPSHRTSLFLFPLAKQMDGVRIILSATAGGSSPG